jgi:DNA-binding LacI/PurR family transcriptional regulator
MPLACPRARFRASLNGSASVSAAKRQAVLEAVRHLGFRPNPVARGLAGGRTLSIGVVTPTMSSPFYGEALGGVEQELATAWATCRCLSAACGVKPVNGMHWMP